nr:hypothetical protein [Tanacetum cinerariifolium]
MITTPGSCLYYTTTIREVTSEADIGAVEHQKKKKMKEVASKPTDTQELLNLKKGTRASKETYILQQIPKTEILTTDDERTKSESEKADEETDNDEEVHDDDEVHEDEEVHEDDDEIADEEKADEEMAGVKKDDSKKIEEEKVDDDQARADQAGDDQAVKDDQAWTLIFQTPLLDVLVLVIPKQTTPTPTTPPTIIEAQDDHVSKSNPSTTVLHRLLELEKKVVELSKVNHSEVIEEPRQANVLNEVRNQIPKFLPKSSSTQADSLSELELKNILLDKMQNSGSFLDHDKHLDLYSALMNSIVLDEAIKKGKLDPAKVLKRKRSDDEDQDPHADTKKEKKKRRRKDSEPSKKSSTSKDSSKGKTPPKTSKTKKSMNAEKTVKELVLDVAMDVEEPILDDVVNDTDQPQDDADPKNETKTQISSIELEYNMKQCYLALSDQLDWVNPKGDRCPYDLSKLLPLQGPPRYLTIPFDFFFNNDLDHLGTRNMKRKNSASITKIKAAKYKVEGIEDMIPRL